MNKFSIFLTNERSLSPKIASLIDFYNEMGVTAGIIMESWFQNSQELDRDLQDLELGTGLKTIYKNRGARNTTARYAGRQLRGGGVAIIFDTSKIDLKEHKIANNKYEMVAASGKQNRSGRRIFIFAIYVPPKM